jgi:hypothetical protein
MRFLPINAQKNLMPRKEGNILRDSTMELLDGGMINPSANQERR